MKRLINIYLSGILYGSMTLVRSYYTKYLLGSIWMVTLFQYNLAYDITVYIILAFVYGTMFDLDIRVEGTKLLTLLIVASGIVLSVVAGNLAPIILSLLGVLDIYFEYAYEILMRRGKNYNFAFILASNLILGFISTVTLFPILRNYLKVEEAWFLCFLIADIIYSFIYLLMYKVNIKDLLFYGGFNILSEIKTIIRNISRKPNYVINGVVYTFIEILIIGSISINTAVNYIIVDRVLYTIKEGTAAIRIAHKHELIKNSNYKSISLTLLHLSSLLVFSVIAMILLWDNKSLLLLIILSAIARMTIPHMSWNRMEIAIVRRNNKIYLMIAAFADITPKLVITLLTMTLSGSILASSVGSMVATVLLYLGYLKTNKKKTVDATP